jgi:hypothetical protein
VVVANAGAAQFLEGDPITMTAEDVIQTAGTVPEARIIAAPMEAINHCLLTATNYARSLTAQDSRSGSRSPPTAKR